MCLVRLGQPLYFSFDFFLKHGLCSISVAARGLLQRGAHNIISNTVVDQ